MGLANAHKIPEREETTQPWTRRQLFKAASAVSAIQKMFNPYELLFVAMVAGFFGLILLNKRIPWFFWVLGLLIFLAGFFERQMKVETDQKKKQTKEEKAEQKLCTPKS